MHDSSDENLDIDIDILKIVANIYYLANNGKPEPKFIIEGCTLTGNKIFIPTIIPVKISPQEIKAFRVTFANPETNLETA